MKARAHAAAASAVAFAVLLVLSPPARHPEPDRPAPEEAVRIEIVKIERMNQTEPSRPPPPPSPSVKPVAKLSDERLLAEGESLLRSGKFPRLRATYSRIGFAAYRDAMLSLGGAFFLFDPSARRPVAEIDPLTGELRAERIRGDLSRWPRDVTRHLGDTLRRGQASYGDRVSRVVLLPPARLDATLLGSLDAHLRGLGLDPGAVLRVDVAYELRAGDLHCDVLLVALRDGTERPLSLEIDLSGGMTGTEVAL